MLVLITYDVADDGDRQRLARLLKGYGERVQLSVFEAHLDEPALARLRTKARRLINEETDSVRYYRLGEDYRSRVEIDGLGVVHEPLDYAIA